MAEAAASVPPAPAAPITPTPQAGLSSAQVAERRSRGLTNAGGEWTSRSFAEILRANILTRFNLILGVLLAVILAVGQPQDALFGIVLVTTTFSLMHAAAEDAAAGRIKAQDAAGLITATLLAAFTPPTKDRTA